MVQSCFLQSWAFAVLGAVLNSSNFLGMYYRGMNLLKQLKAFQSIFCCFGHLRYFFCGMYFFTILPNTADASSHCPAPHYRILHEISGTLPTSGYLSLPLLPCRQCKQITVITAWRCNVPDPASTRSFSYTHCKNVAVASDQCRDVYYQTCPRLPAFPIDLLSQSAHHYIFKKVYISQSLDLVLKKCIIAGLYIVHSLLVSESSIVDKDLFLIF